jgi:hypothetical protein
MERGDQHRPVASCDDVPFAGREDFHVRCGALHPRGTDEHGAHRAPTGAVYRQICLEAAYLAAERVASRDDVHEPQRRRPAFDGVARHNDETGARAVNGAAVSMEVPDGRREVKGIHQLAHRSALAAGDDQAVEAVELSRLAHFDSTCPESLEHDAVLAEVALQGEHAHRQPRPGATHVRVRLWRQDPVEPALAADDGHGGPALTSRDAGSWLLPACARRRCRAWRRQGRRTPRRVLWRRGSWWPP